jgi:hypothetical protein
MAKAPMVSVKDGREPLRTAKMSLAPADSHLAGLEDDGEFILGLYHNKCKSATVEAGHLGMADALEGTSVELECAKCKDSVEALADPNKYGEVFLQLDRPEEGELWYRYKRGTNPNADQEDPE